MTLHFSDVFKMYMSGQLGPARALGLEQFLLYTVAVFLALVICTASYFRILPMSCACVSVLVGAIPAVIGTTLATQALFSSDTNALEWGLVSLIVVPAIWLIPVLEISPIVRLLKRSPEAEGAPCIRPIFIVLIEIAAVVALASEYRFA